METVLDDKAARLGDLPLLLLAISHRHEGTAVSSVDPLSQHHSAGGREPLSEIACGPLDAGNLALDVTLEKILSTSKRRDRLFPIDESQFSEHRVDTG